jgi:hypothetical protein
MDGQLATAWAGQLDLVDAAAEQGRDPSLRARRAAVVAAVRRLFPATAGDADVRAEKTPPGDLWRREGLESPLVGRLLSYGFHLRISCAVPAV